MNLSLPQFQDDAKARAVIENLRWPAGPVCPHCGNLDRDRIARGAGKKHREGLFYCSACNGQFSVTVGTALEGTKIPLSKWLNAILLMADQKNITTVRDLQTELQITYKSAWFLRKRIIEAVAAIKT